MAYSKARSTFRSEDTHFQFSSMKTGRSRMPMACITRWVSMHTTSHGAQRLSSQQMVKFVGSLSAPHRPRGHSLKTSLPLSNFAINIETYPKCVGTLKGILRRRHRILTRDQQLECMPESRFLQPDRDTGPILFPAFETRQPRNKFPNNRC